MPSAENDGLDVVREHIHSRLRERGGGYRRASSNSVTRSRLQEPEGKSPI